MGVKTAISLDELNELFDSYRFTSLVETTSGIIDTTYIVFAKDKSYILKKYERAISQKIEEDSNLLDVLKSCGLNVPKCIESSHNWYLYEKLEGLQPTHIKSYHIQALARFLAKLHQHTYKKESLQNVIEQDEISSHLNYAKANFFSYYKKLQFLKKQNQKSDGIIHGDIFKDNTVFNGTKIGVFDFIDSACGNFAFDAAVALVGFDAKKHKGSFVNLFLNTYNQNAPRKLSKTELLESIETACGFYALKRIVNFKNTKTAKELLK
ncbi:MAG: phosphotransferase [Sulfurimonas sp.]|nr:phosphotransferase [Sulfurimonas sp.]